MNKDTERKLDELLAKMPKRNYDLDAWLSEDETAEFDRLQQTNTDFGLQQTNTDFDSQRMNTDFHGSKRKVWRWVATAACLLIIIGIGITMELMHQKPEDKPVIAENNAQPLPSLAQLPPSLAQPLPPSLAQLFPSLQGEGLGVGSETSKTLSVEKKLQTPPLTPPLEGRGAAAPTKATIEPRRGAAAPTKTVVAPRKAIAQASQQDAIADTLGSGIWEHEENVMLAVQMLSECEQTIRREEQELRNNIIRATFNATPQPAKARLLLNDSGDYMVVEDNGPVIIEL